jgi:hypothetical protein
MIRIVYYTLNHIIIAKKKRRRIIETAPADTKMPVLHTSSIFLVVLVWCGLSQTKFLSE